MRIPRYDAYRRVFLTPLRSVWVRGILAALLIFVGTPAIQVFGEPAWVKWFGTACALALAAPLVAPYDPLAQDIVEGRVQLEGTMRAVMDAAAYLLPGSPLAGGDGGAASGRNMTLRATTVPCHSPAGGEGEDHQHHPEGATTCRRSEPGRSRRCGRASARGSSTRCSPKLRRLNSTAWASVWPTVDASTF